MSALQSLFASLYQRTEILHQRTKLRLVWKRPKLFPSILRATLIKSLPAWVYASKSSYHLESYFLFQHKCKNDIIFKIGTYQQSVLDERTLILVNSSSLNPQGYRGRQLLPTIELSLLNQWTDDCKKNHKNCSIDDKKPWDPKFPMTLIDCESRTICAYTKGMKYVALSYVWGANRLVGLGDFPRLVLDALEVVRGIGLQFLWIDRYCISDNKDVKHEQIKNMDDVYRYAELTIVSLGPDPSHGLPGVNSAG